MRSVSEEANSLAEHVIGAAIEVHRALGPGYLEKTYEEALAVEFGLQRIPFERQRPVAVVYKGHHCGEGFPDFLVSGVLVIELKTVERVTEIHTAQVLSYLKATKLDLGLLINFHVPALKDGVKRIVLTK